MAVKRSMGTLAPAMVAFAIALAGCAAPEDASEALDGETPGTASTAGTLPPLDLAGSSCIEGGGHSVHPKFLNPLPSPWTPADIIDDVGPQVVYSEIPDPTKPIPEKGNTIGNYHATMWCEGWTFRGEALDDHVFGFVGMKVEKPKFDLSNDSPTHHYLSTVFATSHEGVYDALTAAGIHAMHATASREDVGGGFLRIRMGTDHNGDYDSLFKPKPFGEMNALHVRLWFQHENEDGTFTPIALDLEAVLGASHAVADGQGYFSHSGTHHHDPAPGAYGHTAAILYEGFDRTFTWGPKPETAVPDAYVH